MPQATPRRLSLGTLVARALPLAGAWCSVLLIAFVTAARERYLYASTLHTVFWLCVWLYAEVFRGARWRDPPAPFDAQQPAGWKNRALVLLGAVVASGVAVGILWLATSHWSRPNSGGWYGFYVVLFSVFIAGTWHDRAFLNLRAAMVSALVMDVVLVSYEHLLLGQGTGWAYHGSEVYAVFQVPIENALFIYPVASALCSVLCSIQIRRHNHLQAFWRLMGFLTVVFVAVEFVGIGVFHLWSVDEFASQSILPFWHTNIEELVYYFLFQGLSMLFYLWLHQNLDHPGPGPARIGSG